MHPCWVVVPQRQRRPVGGQTGHGGRGMQVRPSLPGMLCDRSAPAESAAVQLRSSEGDRHFFLPWKQPQVTVVRMSGVEHSATNNTLSPCSLTALSGRVWAPEGLFKVAVKTSGGSQWGPGHHAGLSPGPGFHFGSPLVELPSPWKARLAIEWQAVKPGPSGTFRGEQRGRVLLAPSAPGALRAWACPGWPGCWLLAQHAVRVSPFI